MKPSVEAKHVLGEKKHRSAAVVGKRVGYGVLGTVFSSRNKLVIENEVKQAQYREERAQQKTYVAIKELEKNEEIKKAQEGSGEGAVIISAETPTAKIEATVQSYKEEFMQATESWSLKVTTKGKKPLESMFQVNIKPVYDEYSYRKTGETAYVDSINPKNGDRRFYYDEFEQLAMYQTVSRIFGELNQAADAAQATIETVPLQAQAA